MVARRHLGRVSSTVLTSEASPYHAMCLIIGAPLKERYSVSDGTPTYIQTLLKKLGEAEETNPDSVD
jgi:hypothetical protein